MKVNLRGKEKNRSMQTRYQNIFFKQNEPIMKGIIIICSNNKKKEKEKTPTFCEKREEIGTLERQLAAHEHVEHDAQRPLR